MYPSASKRVDKDYIEQLEQYVRQTTAAVQSESFRPAISAFVPQAPSRRVESEITCSQAYPYRLSSSDNALGDHPPKSNPMHNPTFDVISDVSQATNTSHVEHTQTDKLQTAPIEQGVQMLTEDSGSECETAEGVSNLLTFMAPLPLSQPSPGKDSSTSALVRDVKNAFKSHAGYTGVAKQSVPKLTDRSPASMSRDAHLFTCLPRQLDHRALPHKRMSDSLVQVYAELVHPSKC